MSEQTAPKGSDIPCLATGEAFRAVQQAISDPGSVCNRIMDLPRGAGAPEPLPRWQTRAVLSALTKLKAQESRS